MRHHLAYLSTLLCSALLLSGCGTRSTLRTAERTPSDTYAGACVASDTWLSEQILQINHAPEHRVASADLSLGDSRLSTRLDLFIDRNAGMMLSARPLPFMEALRIYLLPDHIALYDMMHDAKVTISYYELSERLDAEVSYPLLRDLLLAEPSYLADHEYSIQRQTLVASLDSPRSEPWVADYMINPQCQLGSIQIYPTSKSVTGHLQGLYSYNDGESRPHAVQLIVSTPRRRISIQLKYSSAKALTPELLRERISEPQGGYTTMTLDDLLRVL